MSWRLAVVHSTGYSYDSPVVSSYNEARLTPQTEPGQLTLEARVETVPTARQFRYWDYWGTQVTAFEVQAPHDALEVVVRSVVETSPAPPPPQPAWELLASDEVRDEHAEWLAPTPRTEPDEALCTAAAGIERRSPYDTALALCDLAADRVSYQSGSTGVRTSAAEAWRLGAGVCQDIAHVSLSLLRSAGLPARYVSGYLHPDPGAELGVARAGESHAWVEVWLGSWWAYDPTNRMPVGERHVVVARGREYGDVPPLKGVYRGHGSHALGVRVELTRLQ